MFKKYFGDMGFWRIALKLAFPVAMQNLLTSSFILVDTIMVGQLGDLSLSAVGMAGQFGWFLNMITFGMCSGAAVFISQYWGAKDTAGIRRTYGIAVVSVCLISALFFVIGLLFPEGVVRIFNREPDVVEAGAAYLRIACWSYLATGVNMVFCIVLRSTENVKLPMYVSLVTTVLNAFMDYGLIFGAFGMPEMGIRGAALATVLSQALSCVWVTSFLCGKKTLLRLRRENLLSGLHLVPPCIALGSSSFVMQASESVISVCFNSSLLKYGGDLAVGAMTILTSVMQFALLPLTGLSQGAQPITSYNYGARNTDRVRQSFRLLLRACLIYSMMLWAFVMLCPRVFAGLFTTDAALLAFTSRALRIYCGGLGLFGIQIACQMTLVSTGNAVCSIIVAVLRKFVLLIPLIYILPCFLPDPTTAVYLAEPVADVLAVTFTAVLFSVQFKKSLQKLETPLQ